MSVKRDVIATLCDVPEEQVTCSKCDSYGYGGWCGAWRQYTNSAAYCTFWSPTHEEDDDAT